MREGQTARSRPGWPGTSGDGSADPSPPPPSRWPALDGNLLVLLSCATPTVLLILSPLRRRPWYALCSRTLSDTPPRRRLEPPSPVVIPPLMAGEPALTSPSKRPDQAAASLSRNRRLSGPLPAAQFGRPQWRKTEGTPPTASAPSASGPATPSTTGCTGASTPAATSPPPYHGGFGGRRPEAVCVLPFGPQASSRTLQTPRPCPAKTSSAGSSITLTRAGGRPPTIIGPTFKGGSTSTGPATRPWCEDLLVRPAPSLWPPTMDNPSKHCSSPCRGTCRKLRRQLKT